ncbi:MAG: DUF4173 domain-containing protein [Actinomycetota bacterium]
MTAVATDEQSEARQQPPLARTVIAVAAALAVIGGVILTWDRLGLQFPMAVVLVVGATVALARRAGRTVSPFAMISMALAVVLSLFTALRAAPDLNAATVITVLALAAAVVLDVLHQRALRSLEWLGAVILLPFVLLQALPEWTKAARIAKITPLTGRQRAVLRGLVISVPVVGLFGVLFASADAVFAGLVGSAFDVEITAPAQVVTRVVLALVFFALIAPVFGLLFASSVDPMTPNLDTPRASAWGIELAMLLGSLNALFGLFVLIQAAYLFGGADLVATGDLTYAEYGRRGFFELVAVSALVFAVGLGLQLFHRLDQHRVVRYLLLGLIAQVGFVFVSAFRRLDLYVDAFGLTQLRFYSQSFMVFLIVAFAVLVWAIIADRPETVLMRTLVITIAIYALGLNVANPDQRIAQRNIAVWEDTGTIDGAYLLRFLSDDAATELVELGEAGAFDGGDLGRFCRRVDDALGVDESWSTANRARHDARLAYSASSVRC